MTIMSIVVVFAWGFAIGMSWNWRVDNFKMFVLGSVTSLICVYGLSWVIKDIQHRLPRDNK